MSTNQVSFFLNGHRVVLDSPPPELLLIDYLRSPEVALTGAKKGCGQGGCGACTVILSRWLPESDAVEHRAINSCLRPVCALDGLSVTTVEGTSGVQQPPPVHLATRASYSRTGMLPHQQLSTLPAAVATAASHVEQRVQSTAEDPVVPTSSPAERPRTASGHVLLNPVAQRLAMNNGTQCGYCTTGFVMNMSALLAANPKPTKRQVEEVFDGNLCRCTGYRPILTGMKTFAVDWTPEDERRRMKCLPDDPSQTQPVSEGIILPFPPEARVEPNPVTVIGGRSWFTPTSLAQLAGLIRDNQGRRLRMVHGNTSFGIYRGEVEAADLLVDIRLIPELSGGTASLRQIDSGAGVSYSELLDVLAEVLGDSPGRETTPLGAVEFMARRTAGTLVRNAASIGGNTMLVLSHIHQGEPFPSDVLTALVAVGAEIDYLDATTGKRGRVPIEELVRLCAADPRMASRLVLLRYFIPGGGERDVVVPQKVALREVNAHSFVNSASWLTVAPDLTIQRAVLPFGGIAPYPWRARETEASLTGTRLAMAVLPRALEVLKSEVTNQLGRWRDRMKSLPYEGITDSYRIDLTMSMLYKAVDNALLKFAPGEVPPEVRSSGEITWGRWPLSDGMQHYEIQDWKTPVSQPYVKIMSMYQASGQVHYTHEIPPPPTTVNGAFVLSRRALASFWFKVPGGSQKASRTELCKHLAGRFAYFVDLITAEQVPPGGINLQGMGSDQPLFAVDQVSYVGQSLALAIAATEQQAEEIADYVAAQCVGYGPVEWPDPWNKPPWTEPVLSLEEAISVGSVFPDYPKAAPFVSHIWKIVRPGSVLEWVNPDRKPLDRSPASRTAKVDGVECLVVESTQTVGGQVHFYMETQACFVQPMDGGRLLVQPSTQSPMEMHQTSAMAVGFQNNRIEVAVRQVGGGYGGKTEPARFVTGPTVVAANHLARPVRVVMPRDDDTAMIGKRHPYYGTYQIAIDPGIARRQDRGLLRGFYNRMWGDGGAFYDCSFIVSNCIQLRADNAYDVANFSNEIEVCRTNTAPNTAFRAFGDIQGKLIVENAVDDAAFSIGMTAEEVREKNLYDRGDVTPFGQALSYCYMKQVWAYLKKVSDYDGKRAAVDAFNSRNRWRKRGIAMVPVKYGSGYNFVQIEQAAAYLAIYSADGSVVIHQGGVDMGQGLVTKVEQVASYILNLPFELLHVRGPNTSVIPNPTSTGASTGTTYSAEAVRQVCEVMRARMTEFGYSLLRENGEEWCKANNVDFWNYGEQGWAAEIADFDGTPKLIWQKLVQQAYARRIDLTASYNARMQGGETPVPALTFKPMDQQRDIPGIQVDRTAMPGGAVDSFSGFTYSAACSTVEVDILTGEVKVLTSDLVYDIGWSLNVALDVGQVEGAFVQGVGYVLSEWLVYQPDGDEKGRLNTDNTWRYKPPAVPTIPLEMNTYLFPRNLAPEVPENPTDVLSSKEVGEPPLVLACSVFLAVKAAVRASRLERGLSGLFRMDAPATVQEVRRACEVSLVKDAVSAGAAVST
ncbi:MAG TPA: molybdopterin cofactor-binding domain-containing protein [Actinomycetota bacterium]|nr:molybdopterin cofactor-binding domain-containing protein [Actinomycetota bacterium]